MGLFSGGGVLGDIGGALGINTDRQEQALTQSIERTGETALEARGLLESAEARALPFLEPVAGVVGDVLPQVQRGATIGGFGENIADILSGGALDPLIQERQRAGTSALASAGLSRSNVAAERAAAIPAELAFNIENLLAGRQSNLLQQGTGAGVNLANLFRGGAQDISNIITGQGAAEAEGIIGQEQIRQQRNQNIAGLFGDFFGGGGGSGGGDFDISSLLALAA